MLISSGGLTTSRALGFTPFTGPLLPGFGYSKTDGQTSVVNRDQRLMPLFYFCMWQATHSLAFRGSGPPRTYRPKAAAVLA